MKCFIPSRGYVMELPHGAVAKVAVAIGKSHSYTTQLLLRGDAKAHEALEPLLAPEEQRDSEQPSGVQQQKKSRSSVPRSTVKEGKSNG